MLNCTLIALHLCECRWSSQLIMIFCVMYSGTFIGRSAVMGYDADIVLSCNSTQSSDVTWTRNTTRGYFHYVSVNGTVIDYRDFRNRFYVVNTSGFRIYIPEPVDSGLYVCYESGGRRIVGYNITVTRMFLIVPASKL